MELKLIKIRKLNIEDPEPVLHFREIITGNRIGPPRSPLEASMCRMKAT